MLCLTEFLEWVAEREIGQGSPDVVGNKEPISAWGAATGKVGGEDCGDRVTATESAPRNLGFPGLR